MLEGVYGVYGVIWEITTITVRTFDKHDAPLHYFLRHLLTHPDNEWQWVNHIPFSNLLYSIPALSGLEILSHSQTYTLFAMLLHLQTRSELPPDTLDVPLSDSKHIQMNPWTLTGHQTITLCGLASVVTYCGTVHWRCNPSRPASVLWVIFLFLYLFRGTYLRLPCLALPHACCLMNHRQFLINGRAMRNVSGVRRIAKASADNKLCEWRHSFWWVDRKKCHQMIAGVAECQRATPNTSVPAMAKLGEHTLLCAFLSPTIHWSNPFMG